MVEWTWGTALVVAVVAAVRGTWSPCGLSMLSAINPLAERGRGNHFGATCAWFVLGAISGGAVLGSGAALLAWVAAPVVRDHPSVSAALAVAAALVCLAADLRVGGFGLPVHPRQVNELWLSRYRRWVYAAGFGAQIGVGFATYIMTAATYLLVCLSVLTGSPPAALAVGTTFGAVRGAAVLISAGVRSPEALAQLHRHLDRWGTSSLRGAIATHVVVAVVLAAVAAGPAGAVGAGSLAVVLLLLAQRNVPVRTPADPGPGRRLLQRR